MLNVSLLEKVGTLIALIFLLGVMGMMLGCGRDQISTNPLPYQFPTPRPTETAHPGGVSDPGCYNPQNLPGVCP